VLSGISERDLIVVNPSGSLADGDAVQARSVEK
jgi:hypothetical protein